MKLLKNIFFLQIGMFPIWVGYVIVGPLITCLSSNGINGYLGPFQTDSNWPVVVGYGVLIAGIPGGLRWIYSFTIGKLIGKKS